jgi:hypothetical protein
VVATDTDAPGETIALKVAAKIDAKEHFKAALLKRQKVIDSSLGLLEWLRTPTD